MTSPFLVMSSYSKAMASAGKEISDQNGHGLISYMSHVRNTPKVR